MSGPHAVEDVEIRRARAEDADAIARVGAVSWRESYADLIPRHVLRGLSARQRDNRGARPRSDRFAALYVADHATHGVVGFGSCGPARGRGDSLIGEVYELYILRSAGRRGLGRSLMAMMAGWLQGHALEPAVVWVLRDNAPARAFYERLGGTVCARRPIQVHDVALPAVAYRYGDLDVLTGLRPPAAAVPWAGMPWPGRPEPG